MKRPPKKNRHRVLKILLVSFILLAFITAGILTVLVVSASQIDISRLDNPLPTPLVFFDMNGDQISQRSSVRFQVIPLSEIPDHAIDAIIAVEDQRFYEHAGVDVRGIARSFFRNIEAGAVVQGGSTLTQQLARTMFLSLEQTYTRKFTEAVTALRIERRYSKDEILELYLNQIYFGESAWGIQVASQTYFGKGIQEVTLSEAALLAALPRAPTHYSPFSNPERALERRNLVLSLLHEQERISENEYEQAVSEPIVLREGELEQAINLYPSYVDHVISEAVQMLGMSEEDMMSGGLHIHTHLDPVVQNAIEAAYARDELFPEGTGDALVQSGAIVIDPSSGGIRGLIGSRGDYVYHGFNRATQLKRQPGSALKPLAVYAPALELGYTRNSLLMDEEIDFGGYVPSNFSNTFQGQVTLYQALVQSINVPAVALLDEIGISRGIDFLERAGIPVHTNDRILGLALGGMTEGVSPLEMAQAYSLFPNLGTMVQAHAIARITTSDGDVLLEVNPQAVQVTSPEIAYAMTEMLMGVVQEGTGGNAAIGRPTAGKTGTTQLPDTEAYEGVEGVGDVWFVGYTPELVTAVWIGYDTWAPEYVMQSAGGTHPARIFQAIMSAALANRPVTSFAIPENYQREQVPSILPEAEENENEEDEDEEVDNDVEEDDEFWDEYEEDQSFDADDQSDGAEGQGEYDGEPGQITPPGQVNNPGQGSNRGNNQ